MLRSKKHFILAGTFLALTGCASYSASMLTTLPVEEARPLHQNSNVLVSCKIFSQQDSRTYLGRDLIAEGYIPVQMTIRNNGSDPMYLNPANFNFVVPPVSEVANKVHTSTTARVMGWGIPGLIIFPLLIPAVYDGIKSNEANAALDADYLDKAIKEQTIQPHSSFNGIVFIPREQAGKSVEVYLVNQRTSEKVLCPLIGSSSR